MNVFAELVRVNKLTSQTQSVLAHLRRYGSISPMEAQVAYGIMRLASRIHELKKTGYEISTELRQDGAGHRYARYHIQQALA